MYSAGFEVDLRSLRRNWFDDYGELRFTLSLDAHEVTGLDTEAIIEVARGVTEELHTSGASNPVVSEGWLKTRTGWAATLQNAYAWDDALEWLDLFASRWGGLTGQIRGGPSRALPRWALNWDFRQVPQLTVFAAYTTTDLTTVDSERRRRVWGVDATFTHALSDQIVNWVQFPRASTYVEYDGGIEVSDPDVGLAIAELLVRRNWDVGITQAHELTKRLRVCHCEPHGKVVYQVRDDSVSWQVRLDDLRRMLVWASQRLDLSFIRYTMSSGFWAGPYYPDFPHITESDVRYNRPLLASFVPDASGVQVLTDAHLTRASDLSDWSVEPLPGGRHLVTTRDLAGWYAQAEPEPDLLASARRDFGEMILTSDSLEANSPWR